MMRKILLPVLAVLGFAFALYTVITGAKPVAIARAAAEPAEAPYDDTIAGAGIVEARSQNIAVGTPVPGVVTKLAVQVGSRVKAGEPLFQVDDRDRRAELLVRRAASKSAQAELARVVGLPRKEDLPPAEASAVAARAALSDMQNQLALAESLPDKRAIATQEWDRRRFAVRVAEARAEQADSELAKLVAGAWEPDLEIARAALALAETRVEAQEIEIDRLTIRAPVDGTVLQVNIRLGEFAPSGVLAQPLLVLGDVDVMHVRVDIDENDAWRFRAGAPATAYVRGNRDLKTDMTFVRVDPYVIPKRSLTGESAERVDTRVLQVLYRFDPTHLTVYVGQQMDVFIEARVSRAAAGVGASGAGAEPGDRR